MADRVLLSITPAKAPNHYDMLLVVDAAGREFMVPLVEEFVDAIEPGLDRVVVHPIPGLLPGSDDSEDR